MKKKTRITGYWANGTECSDHNLTKYNKFFQTIVVFSAWCDKKSLKRRLGIFGSYIKIREMKNIQVFMEKILKKVEKIYIKKIIFHVLEFFGFLKILILKRR